MTFSAAANVKRRGLPLGGAAVLVLLGIALTAGGARAVSRTRGASTVEVLAPYVESDRATFMRVLDAFTARTGINVEYTPCCTGSLPQLQTRLAAGDPPDVAVVFRPGELPTFAHAGDLVPLASLGLTSVNMRRNFGTGLLRRATVGGVLNAVPLKASSKSLIWYKPDSFRRYGFHVPHTWRQLLAITRGYRARRLVPWAVGCGPGPEDSWTLTDWFENIFLRTAGPARYERLFAGRLPFTDRFVAHAVRLMLQIVNDKSTLGGTKAALTTSWIDALSSVFGRAAKAELYMEGGFVGQIAVGQLNTALRPGLTIGSMPWPTINPRLSNATVGGADFAVALDNNAVARKLLLYLSSSAAGKVWASAGRVTGSWSVSPNRLVPRALYANALVANEAHQVANAQSFEFDGSDELPGNLSETWAATLQDIVKAPARLKQTLSHFGREAQRAFGASG
jgi:alpha-glucoside transport system substrate-binding protein